MTKIAFLGIGAMGDRICNNLLEAGFDLSVWNRTPEKCENLVKKGARNRPSIQETIKDADIVMAMVTDDQASRNIWLNETDGAIIPLKPNTIVMELSTLTPKWCQELAKKVTDRGCHFLEAPVVGTRPHAEAKKLIHLVSGDTIVFEKVKPTLAHISQTTHYLGEIGTAMTIKLAINALFASQVVAFSETLALLQNAGVNTTSVVDLLKGLPITSPALSTIVTLIADENYQPLFPIDLVEKDLAYVEEIAQGIELSVPLIQQVRRIYQQGQEAGYGQDNINGIAQIYS